MSPTRCRTIPGLLAACLLGGCASGPGRVTSYKPPVPPRGLVLVADGAGGDPVAAAAMAAAVRKSGDPLAVLPFDWSHGRGRVLADMTDVEHAQEQGRRLADHICRYRAGNPRSPVYLVGYSAGAHVVLEAAGRLPPDTLERVVLLAPAVSADYDLRPALAAARRGVDAFTSERDGLYLGLGTGLVGTADGQRGVPAAGRVGFDPPAAGLAGRLRQHPWDPAIAWTGNEGTHAGTLRAAYLRAYVLPLLAAPGPPAPGR